LRALARPPNTTVLKTHTATVLHAGAATRRYTPEMLLLSSLLSLAGAINNFFMAYPQKYKNCSTLSTITFLNNTAKRNDFPQLKKWENIYSCV
jgi:hypothetical protein